MVRSLYDDPLIGQPLGPVEQVDHLFYISRAKIRKISQSSKFFPMIYYHEVSCPRCDTPTFNIVMAEESRRIRYPGYPQVIKPSILSRIQPILGTFREILGAARKIRGEYFPSGAEFYPSGAEYRVMAWVKTVSCPRTRAYYSCFIHFLSRLSRLSHTGSKKSYVWDRRDRRVLFALTLLPRA